MGSVEEATLVWAVGDIGVGLMAWMNIIAILALGNVTPKGLKDYNLKEARN